MAGVIAAGGFLTAILISPVALADTCDPAVTVCQGGDVQPGTSASPDYAPPVVASDDQYPFDDDWYFDPAGGGTALQPEHPSGGGGGGGGGGHH
jgi:hypothetical protein